MVLLFQHSDHQTTQKDNWYQKYSHSVFEASVFTTKLRVSLIQVKLTKGGENPFGGNAIMNAVHSCPKGLMG